MSVKVLIVEDYQPIRELAVRFLLAHGYTPVEVGSGEDALATAPVEKPDIIMLDIGLPGIDGWETLQRLKASPETAQIPVVIVTAMGRGDDIVRGYSLGAACYIVKPYRIDGLLHAFDVALSGVRPLPSEELAARRLPAQE